jgi:hypothetical protein
MDTGLRRYDDINAVCWRDSALNASAAQRRGETET